MIILILALFGILILSAVIIFYFLLQSNSTSTPHPRPARVFFPFLQEDKGSAGERQVARILGSTVEGEQYVVNNLLFRTSSGMTCQIDHIYINHYGTWVIETKNYAGMIYGQENASEWLQVLACGKTKNKFYNPIRQNASHIYQLTELMDKKFGFHNVVVFTENADLSHVAASNVIHPRQLKQFTQLESDIWLPDEEMRSRYDTLLEIKAAFADLTVDEHVDNIRKMQADIESGICPRCGRQLIERYGKNGAFLGCKGYPDCTFTRRL